MLIRQFLKTEIFYISVRDIKEKEFGKIYRLDRVVLGKIKN